MIAQVAISKELKLERGLEQLITWGKTTKDEKPPHHTKKEYLKIHQDGKYLVEYNIKWKYMQETTQPLQANVYKVTKDFELIRLHEHVTVCNGNIVNLKKKFPFDLRAKERICIGIKNLSCVDFIILEANLSLSK